MTHQTASAYPLTWPPGRPRTRPGGRSTSRFKTTFVKARDNLIEELERIGARETILSTNLELNLAGQPRGNTGQPGDPGVAVYFTRNKKQLCFACDRWLTVGDNIHAVALTIGAVRGIQRWGSGHEMEAAFTGFAALPAPAYAKWREILDCPDAKTLDDLDRAYEIARGKAHPDRQGGSDDAFVMVQNAYELARAELGS